MAIEGPLTFEQEACLETLRSTDRVGLKKMFRDLKPPQMETFSGEFDAELLEQGGRVASLLTRSAFGVYGPWIGKAFKPLSATSGTGYNCFRYGDKIMPKLPMDTVIADSRLSRGKSLIINYRAKNSGVVRWLIGELRVVVPTVILGFGAFGPQVGARDVWRRKIPFVLVGPMRSYQLEQAA